MLRILVAVVALTACHLDAAPRQGGSEESVRAFCRAARGVGQYPEQPTVDEAVIRALCGDVRSASLEVYADRIDQSHPDSVHTGLLVYACVENGTCRLDGAKDWYDPYCVPGANRCNFSPSRAADVAYYLHELTTDGMRADLARSAFLPPAVRAAFVAAVEDAKRTLAASLGKLDPRRRAIYVSTVEKVRARRREDDQALERFTAKLATWKPEVDRALLDKRVTRAMIDETIGLRDSYVLACLERKRTPLHCLTGPVARPLSRLIVRAAVALGDAALAETENAVLAFGPSRENVLVEIRMAVSAAMAAENALHAEWKKARDAGTDPGVLAGKFGDPAPWNLERETTQAGFGPDGVMSFDADISALGRNRVDTVARQLRAVHIRGKRALLVFDDVSGIAFTRRCHTLGDAEHVSCSGEPWGDAQGNVAPIEVPAYEASRLAPGDLVHAIADAKTRAGYIVQVLSRDGVQYRAFRGMRGSNG
jgi:hypothetical protein